MRNENFAERLFCDLRNAEIKIVKASYRVDGHKIGDGKDCRQFNIFEINGNFNFGEGVGGNREVGKMFTEAYQELFDAVKSIGPKIKFYSLVVPSKACVEARLEEFETVVTRYIVDYLQMSDQIAARWDVLVGPAD